MTAIKARPTTYAGVKMRSRLEADYAAALDQPPVISWEYEPTCFAGPPGQWLPDFKVTFPTGAYGYTELKPAGLYLGGGQDHSEEILTLLRQIEIARLSEPRAGLGLVFWTYGARSYDLFYRLQPRSERWHILLPGARIFPGPEVVG